LSDLAASVLEIIASNIAVSAGREITRQTTGAFKNIRNGINHEARVAVGQARGVTSEPVHL